MTDASRLVILDRDGVINEDSDDYIKSPAEWIAIPGSAEAIARLKQAGYTIVVATNQSGVGRGYYDMATLDAIHAKMFDTVNTAGGHIDAVFACPHTPADQCDCRKPLPGLLDQISAWLGSPVAGAWLVGDSLRDLECGLARACRPALVRSGKGERTLAKGLPTPLSNVPVFDNLADFANHLMS